MNWIRSNSNQPRLDCEIKDLIVDGTLDVLTGIYVGATGNLFNTFSYGTGALSWSGILGSISSQFSFQNVGKSVLLELQPFTGTSTGNTALTSATVLPTGIRPARNVIAPAWIQNGSTGGTNSYVNGTIAVNTAGNVILYDGAIPTGFPQANNIGLAFDVSAIYTLI